DHRRRKGFRRATPAADRASGTVVITTYWDSQADSDAQGRDASRAGLTAQVRLLHLRPPARLDPSSPRTDDPAASRPGSGGSRTPLGGRGSEERPALG